MARPERRSLRDFAVARLTVLLWLMAGCASVSAGGLTVSPNRPTGLAILWADPDVLIERPAGNPIAYQPGMDLFTGDVIETRGGQAVVEFSDGNVVDLNRSTKIELGSIRLFFGELFSRIANITRRGGGQVVTNELTAAVEGTEFLVRRSASRADTSVVVRKGRVLCSPAGGATWAPLSLTENQLFSAYGQKAAPQPVPVDATAESRWADETEKRLRGGRPPHSDIQAPISPKKDSPPPPKPPSSYLPR